MANSTLVDGKLILLDKVKNKDLDFKLYQIIISIKDILKIIKDKVMVSCLIISDLIFIKILFIKVIGKKDLNKAKGIKFKMIFNI